MGRNDMETIADMLPRWAKDHGCNLGQLLADVASGELFEVLGNIRANLYTFELSLTVKSVDTGKVEIRDPYSLKPISPLEALGESA